MIAVRDKQARVWERDELDWYVEPPRATTALLSQESFFGQILDPCCGCGNIVRTLRERGHAAFGSDVVDRGLSLDDGWLGERDFLADGLPQRPENIVMNPPFFRAKGAEAFIRYACAIARRKVAAFVDIRFITGAQRANGLFAERPPHRIWIITPRVSCPPGAILASGGKAEGGTADWCWLIWDRNAPTIPTRLGWLREAAE